MKNFCFDTICNITQEPLELERFNCTFFSAVFGKSAVIKYNVSSIAVKRYWY